MATTAYFIGAQFIKDYSFVDPNVDEKTLMVGIHEAQTITIKEYIGSGLYDDLQTKGLTDISYSAYPLYATLVNDYIAQALKWWAIYECSPFLKFKITNKDIVSKTSDNSSGANISELEKILQYIEYKARYYTNRMVKYLIENQSSYPLYINPGSGVDDIYPNKEAFDSDIYLGNRGDNCLPPKEYNERNQIDWS